MRGGWCRRDECLSLMTCSHLIRRAHGYAAAVIPTLLTPRDWVLPMGGEWKRRCSLQVRHSRGHVLPLPLFPSSPVHGMKMGILFALEMCKGYTPIWAEIFSPVLPHFLKLLPRYWVRKQTVGVQFRRKKEHIEVKLFYIYIYSFIKNCIEYFLCSKDWDKH